MARVKPEECKHPRAEAGDMCPDCGVEVEDPMLEKVAKRVRREVEEVLDAAGLMPPKEPPPAEKPPEKKTLWDRLQGEKK